MGLSTLSPSEVHPSQFMSSPESADAAVSMTKCAIDSGRVSKRKGTRSVSTLTPSQLARKRANDREAQRAIRARTKEHIDSLERQVEELRGQQGRDRLVQELLRRNKALEDELRRLREGLGLPTNNIGGGGNLYKQAPPPSSSSSSSSSSSASAAAYPRTCTRTPPFCPTAPEYQVMQDGHAPYGNINDSGGGGGGGGGGGWPQTASAVSSPSSRCADDYGPGGYLAASMPPGVLERASLPPAANTGIKGGGGGNYEDIKSEFGCPPVSVVPLTSTAFQPQQSWNFYPFYYDPTAGAPPTM